MDVLISDKPYDLVWKKRGSKYLTDDEVHELHKSLVTASIHGFEAVAVDEPMVFGAPVSDSNETPFTGLPYLIGNEDEESVGTSIPYLCSEDLIFIICTESGDGYL